MAFTNTKALYEGYPFPFREPTDERLRLITTTPDHLGKLNHFCFAGLCDFNDASRFLVAGGGTGDAAVYLAEQLSYRGRGRVVYIDQSEASMHIAKTRADIRGLTNIDWINGSILDIDPDDLGCFDYINCVGVIHHLNQPIEGLLKLKSVLKTDGVLCLMVYGRYGRRDISDVRDLFKSYKRVSDPKTIIEDAKTILSSLAPTNSYMRGRDRSTVLSLLLSDLPNLADIFLNPVEWVYSSDELASLVEDEAGMLINKFTTYDCAPAICSLQYDPSLLISDPEIRANLKKLDKREQWKIAEILDGSMHLHCIYVQRTKSDVADFRNNNLIPFFESEQTKQTVSLLVQQNNGPLNIELSNGAHFPLSISGKTREFLGYVNNQNSIKEILIRVSISYKDVPILLNELRLLGELEWVLLRGADVQPFLNINNGVDVAQNFIEKSRISFNFPGMHKING
jgi:SAM-dependent methyltransferase